MTVADVNIMEGESEEAVITVSWNQPYPEDVSFIYYADGGTTDANYDYELSTDSYFVLPAGKTTYEFEISILDDSESEAVETLDIRIEDSYSNYEYNEEESDFIGIVTIEDNE